MKKYLFLLVTIWFVLPNVVLAQTEEFSWVYLYYTNVFGMHSTTLTILFNDKETLQIDEKERIKCKVYSTGNIKISGFSMSTGMIGYQEYKHERGFVTLNIKHGKTYYVKIYQLNLKIVDEITGEKEFSNSKLAEIQYFEEDIKDPLIKKEALLPTDNKITTNNRKIVTDNNKTVIISEVDIDIPINNINKPNTYALIIGNEDYSSFQTGLNTEVNVDFAINDAKIFKEYCNKTLGIPEKQIKLLINATFGQMNQGIAWLNNLAKVDNGNAELIFYYSGHGLPDEQTKESYIMPVDISGNSVTQAIKLADIYNKLNEHPSKKVTVFIDACFSGGARNQGLIAMKGVRVKPKENMITGNMIVLSSSTGVESSGVFREKQHGFMTYFLLKKLQESKGNVSYKELADFIIENVKKETALIGKIQTPQLKFSPSVEGTWTNWKIK